MSFSNVGKRETNQEDLGILILGCPTYLLCCLNDLYPQGLHSTPWNFGGAPGWQLQTDNSGACHPNFSPVPGVLLIPGALGFPSSPDITPCCILPSSWDIRVSAMGLFRACLGVSTLTVSWGTQRRPTPFLFSPFQQRSRDATSSLPSSLWTWGNTELVPIISTLVIHRVVYTALSPDLTWGDPHTNPSEERKGMTPTLQRRTTDVLGEWDAMSEGEHRPVECESIWTPWGKNKTPAPQGKWLLGNSTASV